MKTATGVIVLIAVLLGCSRGPDPREAFRQLSSDWDKAYQAVFELVDLAETEQMDWEEQYQNIKMFDAELSVHDDAARTRLLDLKEQCRLHGETYGAIAEEVEAFALNFENQTSQLEELETRLAEGRQIEGLEGKIDYFRNILIKMTPRMASWKDRLKKAKTECRQSCGQYMRFVSKGVES